MIVLGAVLGYITPYLRRRLFGDRPIDFMPRKAAWRNSEENQDDFEDGYVNSQQDYQQEVDDWSIGTDRHKVSESSGFTNVELQATDSQNANFQAIDSQVTDAQATDSQVIQQHIEKLAKETERANHYSQLATERKLALDSYRGEVKQHFVEVAKVLNDDHKDADVLNQALINQIGVGAEQLVGAQSMQGALGKPAITSPEISPVETSKVGETSSVDASPEYAHTHEFSQPDHANKQADAKQADAKDEQAEESQPRGMGFASRVSSRDNDSSYLNDRHDKRDGLEAYRSERITKAPSEVASKIIAKPVIKPSDKAEKQDEWIPVEAEDEAKQEIDAFFADNQIDNQVRNYEIAKEPVDSLQDRTPTNYVAGENRFKEIAEGIEGKSANTFSGVKSWFKGVAGAASASMPKTILGKKTNENKVSERDRSALVTELPKKEIRYENGVLIDDSVLDSGWDLDSVVIKDSRPFQVDAPEFTSSLESDIKPDIKPVADIEEDYRSAFVYESGSQSGSQSASQAQFKKESQVAQNDNVLRLSTKAESDAEQNELSLREKPVAAEKDFGEEAKYLGLQQGFRAGSSHAPEVTEPVHTEVITAAPTLAPTLAQVDDANANSEMLDPYDRITDAVLKESSNQNMNDEKKIVHELFYVRGHQSNVSGRVMSNINPGIPKDN